MLVSFSANSGSSSGSPVGGTTMPATDSGDGWLRLLLMTLLGVMLLGLGTLTRRLARSR